jgi:F-type H+-transporting ATPase subunit a
MPHDMTWFDLIFGDLLTDWRSRLEGLVGKSYLNDAPISIQYIVGFAFIAVLLILLAITVRGKIAKVDRALLPDGKFNLRSFVEMMTEGTLSVMEGMMDRKTATFFLPLIGTCAFVILLSNLLGLVPGFLPPTSNLNTTLAMAIIIFITTHIYGIKEHGFFKYFAHWMGPLRKWYALPLMLLMLGIEIISHVARPLSLSVRLMGNMFADHAVVGTFAALIPLIVPVPMMVLGVLVCIVQTLVFCILSTVYIGLAVAHEEH